jgi:hypothetical protein
MADLGALGTERGSAPGRSDQLGEGMHEISQGRRTPSLPMERANTHAAAVLSPSQPSGVSVGDFNGVGTTAYAVRHE